MKGKEESVMTMNNEPARSKKHAKLYKSFSHISKALKKLHGGGRANSSDKSSSPSFLSGCMHPRTHSFASSRRRRRSTAANCGCELEHDDDDGALAVDFRSLRLGSAADVADDDGGSSSTTQDSYTDHGMSTTGKSGGGTPAAEPVVAVAGVGVVAVVTFSATPYEDFRRSMREMVDAARGDDAPAAASSRAPPAIDWDLMEELLFCYLELNDRTVHRDILRAFTDTVTALRRRRGPVPLSASKTTTRRMRRQRRRRPREEHDAVDGAEAAVVSS